MKTWGFLIASVVLFALFALLESKVREPLIPLRMFRSLPLTAGTVLMVLMAFAFMGGLFFVTFYLQNVHGMTPVDSGLHLLPLTGMMIVGLAAGRRPDHQVRPAHPAGRRHGPHCRRHVRHVRPRHRHGHRPDVLWFALLGLGLAPVMVGATEVIVGNAPLELSGVAGGLQQAAMQVGGSLGTAVLGAVMASRVDSDLPDNWRSAGLPPVPPAQSSQLSDAVSAGIAPIPKGTPPEFAQKITSVAHDTFVSGMAQAFTVACGVAVVAAVVAFFTKRGANAEAGAGVGHI